MTGYPSAIHLIDGRWTASDSGRTIPVANPATGEEIGTVAHADRPELDRALAAAQKGFEVWRKVSAFDRSKIMRKAAELLRTRADAIARTMTMAGYASLWSRAFLLLSDAASLARRGSYHGATFGAMSLTTTYRATGEKYFGALMYGVHHVPSPNQYRNDFGIEGEIELAQSTPQSPIAQQRTNVGWYWLNR